MNAAMILAAGRGERLKPFTQKVPKAMCIVKGAPLIEHHVCNLAKANIKQIVINHAYLGCKIKQHLGTGGRFGVDIIYSPEAPGGYETGGGIQNALTYFGTSPFLVVNADIFTDFPFDKLNQNLKTLAHIVLVKKPDYYRNGDFDIGLNAKVTNDRVHTFSGISCYDPIFFEECKPGRYSVTPLFRNAVAKRTLTGELYQGLWVDMGEKSRFDLFREC